MNSTFSRPKHHGGVCVYVHTMLRGERFIRCFNFFRYFVPSYVPAPRYSTRRDPFVYIHILYMGRNSWIETETAHR